MIERIKEFYSDHEEGCIGAIVITILASIIIFLSIPITGSITIEHLRWNWDIPVQRYEACSHTSDWWPLLTHMIYGQNRFDYTIKLHYKEAA